MECLGQSNNVNLDSEAPPQAKRFKHSTDEQNDGGGDEPENAPVPLAEVFSVHKAIRRNLELFRSKVLALSVPSTEQVYSEVAARLAFFRRMMDHHCQSEKEVLCPALATKLKASTATDMKDAQVFLDSWHGKHNELDTRFDRVLDIIRKLQRTSNSQNTVEVAEVLDELQKVEIGKLFDYINVHLLEEEQMLLPLFSQVFTVDEQGKLLVSILAVIFAAPLLPWTVRALSERERIDFLRIIEKYSTEEQLAEIAGYIAHDLPSSEWRNLCTLLPAFETAAKMKATPLIEIKHIHKAIRNELDDLVKFCKNLDPVDDAQLHSLGIRFKFLRLVHSFHSEGEDQVILKELEAKLWKEMKGPSNLHEQHDDEAALFVTLNGQVDRMISVTKDDEGGRKSEKDALVEMMNSFAQHLYSHMDDEETNILPLVEKYFSVEDQDQLVRRAMAKVPTEFLSELIHWCLAALSMDEQERLLRNVLRTSPEDEFRNIAVAVATSVQKGEKSRREWDELCLRIPELQAKSNGMAETGAFSDDIPINEILRVHKAIRIELQAILDSSLALSESTNPNDVAALAERCSFLHRMVHFHSKAEDSIVLPLVEKRVANISKSYNDEHSDERRLFEALAKQLENLQCSGDEDVAMSVYVLARTLRDDMLQHLKMEESHLWPLLVENFSLEEQSEVVSMIFGQMPAEILQEMLPWMIRVLSVSEREEMMNHIYAVTGSTLFEKWLQTWFPITSSSQEHGPSEAVASDLPEESAALALVLLRGKEDVQRAVRLVAADQSLSPEQKSRLMQNLLVAKWMRNPSEESAQREVDPSDRVKSFIYLPDGSKVLGCKHYQRKCKVRARCCGKLFACRLCHDVGSNHTMNRYQVEEIWCMECDELQPVAAECSACGTRFAKYFCRICRLYDENRFRNVYHCHSCNVCRVGKGLGIDFFHCMKCNACISLARKDHKCIEKVMESNCPICNNYLFSSTTPIKYLSCGHLMHKHCYSQYAKLYRRCPICQKSLEDMTSHMNRLNVLMAREPMPSEYRTARASVRCNDCGKSSSVPFHFFYLRCGHCQSCNTNLQRVEPNGGDRHS